MVGFCFYVSQSENALIGYQNRFSLNIVNTRLCIRVQVRHLNLWYWRKSLRYQIESVLNIFFVCFRSGWNEGGHNTALGLRDGWVTGTAQRCFVEGLLSCTLFFSCGFLLLWVSILYRAVTSCQWMLSWRSNSSFLFVLYQMSKRDEMIDRLKSETSYLKDQQRDKEREVRIFFYNIFVFFCLS